MAAFLPETLADFAKSGLNDDTISKMSRMGVSSIPGNELDSRFTAAGVQLATKYDYLRLNGMSPFCRLKFHPALVKPDGKIQKYYQPGESGVRLYVPEPIIDTFRDKNAPLDLTEGEKKAWAGVQNGLPMAALGGIYNFNDKKTDWLVPELDEVLKPGREITYTPDALVWNDLRKLESVFRLGTKVELRTGRFYVVRLPVGPGGSEMGLDDFLKAYGVDEFQKLPRLTLKSAHFTPFKKQQAFVNKKRYEAEADTGPEIQIPASLAGKLFHPALHLEKDFAAVGITLRESTRHNFYILTDDGTFPANKIKENLTTKPIVHPELSSRWHTSSKVPSLSESVGLCIAQMQRLLSLESLDGDDKKMSPWLSLFATYCAATYVFMMFRTFPYINLRGEAGSGKNQSPRLLPAARF